MASESNPDVKPIGADQQISADDAVRDLFGEEPPAPSPTATLAVESDAVLTGDSSPPGSGASFRRRLFARSRRPIRDWVITPFRKFAERLETQHPQLTQALFWLGVCLWVAAGAIAVLSYQGIL